MVMCFTFRMVERVPSEAETAEEKPVISLKYEMSQWRDKNSKCSMRHSVELASPVRHTSTSGLTSTIVLRE